MKFTEAYSIGKAVEAGWNAVKRAPLALLVAALILVVLDSNCGIEGDDFRDAPRWALEYFGLALFAGGVFSVLFFLLKVYITPGYMRTAGRAVYGQRPNIERVFGSTDRFLDMLIWKIIRNGLMLLTVIGLIIPLIPLGLVGGVTAAFGHELFDSVQGAGWVLVLFAMLYGLFVAVPVLVYVESGLFFGVFLVSLEGMSATNALKESWRMAKGNRLWLIVYRLALFAVSILGLFAFVVGVVATKAIADAGMVGSFLAWRKNGWPPAAFGDVAAPVPPAGPSPHPGAPAPGMPPVPGRPSAGHTPSSPGSVPEGSQPQPGGEPQSGAHPQAGPHPQTGAHPTNPTPRFTGAMPPPMPPAAPPSFTSSEPADETGVPSGSDSPQSDSVGKGEMPGGPLGPDWDPLEDILKDMTSDDPSKRDEGDDEDPNGRRPLPPVPPKGSPD